MFRFLALALLATVTNSAYVPPSGENCNLTGCHQMCLSHNCTRGDCVLDQCACFGCAREEVKVIAPKAESFGCNKTVCQACCAEHGCNTAKCRLGGMCACFDCNHTLTRTERVETPCMEQICYVRCVVEYGSQNGTCIGDNCNCTRCNTTNCNLSCGLHRQGTGACKNGQCHCNNNHTTALSTHVESKCNTLMCEFGCMLGGAKNGTCIEDKCTCMGCNKTICKMSCHALYNKTGMCIEEECHCENNTITALIAPPTCTDNGCQNTCTVRGFALSSCDNGICHCLVGNDKVILDWNCEHDAQRCSDMCHTLGCRSGICNATGCYCSLCNEANEPTPPICTVGGCLGRCTARGCRSSKCSGSHCTCLDCLPACNGTSCASKCLSNRCFGGSLCTNGQCNCNGCQEDTTTYITRPCPNCGAICMGKGCTGGFCINGACSCSGCGGGGSCANCAGSCAARRCTSGSCVGGRCSCGGCH